MAQQPGYGGRAARSNSTIVTLVAAGVLFIALFLPWNSFGGGDFGGIDIPGLSVNGWNGMGMIAGILAIALLVWEGMNMAGALSNVNAPVSKITAGLAAGAALFAIIRFFQALQGVSFGAFLGLLAALGLAYAAWLKFNEGTMGPAAPPPPPAA